MKIKDLKGFPKEKEELEGVYSDDIAEIDGYNQALSELGEIEIEIDEKVALEIIRPVMSYKEMEELAHAFKTAEGIIKVKK